MNKVDIESNMCYVFTFCYYIGCCYTWLQNSQFFRSW